MESEDVFRAAVGATIRAVEIRQTGERILWLRGVKDTARLLLDDGRVLQLQLDAECCSSSYFADRQQFDDLIGATIRAVELRGGKTERDEDGDKIEWAFLVFTTDRGHVTIDWRNDSSGPYSGWLTAEIVPAS